MKHPQPPQHRGIGTLGQPMSNLVQLHEYVFACDEQGRIAWMSDALEHLVGNHFLARPCTDLLPDLENLAPQISMGGQGSLAGTEFRGGDTSYQADTFVLSLPVNTDEDWASLAILRLSEDATATATPERPEADTLAAMLDNAPDGVIALDPYGFISYANPVLKTLLGKSPAALLHQPVALLLPRTGGFCEIATTVQPNGDLAGDVEVKRPDGSRVWISVSSRSLRLPDGRCAGKVAFLRDVTETKRTQQRLERKNTELESYVHSVSHDLRSPLVSLLGFGRLLRQDYESLLDETGCHFLDRIEQAGRTMEALIEDLLELSRIGQSGENATLTDPRSVLLQLKAELKPRLDEGNFALHIPSSPPLVTCDRTRLYQVFSNLIGNAIGHMGDRSDPEISVEIISRPGHHQISVRDNGTGIDPKQHERIFEVFQSLGRRDNKGQCNGIGLAIVKKIAEIHDGRAWVESAPGEGASFHVTLPIA